MITKTQQNCNISLIGNLTLFLLLTLGQVGSPAAQDLVALLDATGGAADDSGWDEVQGARQLALLLSGETTDDIVVQSTDIDTLIRDPGGSELEPVGNTQAEPSDNTQLEPIADGIEVELQLVDQLIDLYSAASDFPLESDVWVEIDSGFEDQLRLNTDGFDKDSLEPRASIDAIDADPVDIDFLEFESGEEMLADEGLDRGFGSGFDQIEDLSATDDSLFDDEFYEPGTDDGWNGESFEGVEEEFVDEGFVESDFDTGFDTGTDPEDIEDSQVFSDEFDDPSADQFVDDDVSEQDFFDGDLSDEGTIEDGLIEDGLNDDGLGENDFDADEFIDDDPGEDGFIDENFGDEFPVEEQFEDDFFEDDLPEDGEFGEDDFFPDDVEEEFEDEFFDDESFEEEFFEEEVLEEEFFDEDFG